MPEESYKIVPIQVDLTPEVLKDVEDKIRQARFKLLLDHEFFGQVAVQLRLKITEDVRTAAVDGRTIFFNPHFVNMLTLQETVFLVAHEVWHVVFEHFLRRGNRVPQWWNMAGDYVINYLLVRDRIGQMINYRNDKGVRTNKQLGLYDAKYKDKTTEEIYDEFEKEAKEFLDTLDDHFFVGEGENGIPEEEVKAIRDAVRNTIIQAAKSAGNLPGEVKRIVDQFLNPQIKWQDLLNVTIASKSKYDSSFSRPDRKSWSNPINAIFPGALPGETINVGIAIDNSGSITNDMLKHFMSEIYGMMQSYDSFRILVWCFDTQVSGLQEFTEDNSDELRNFEMTGGGGTAIASNFRYIEDEDLDIDLFVCFTDLYSSDLHTINPHLVDTVWIIEGNPTGVPPFGKYAYYKP